MCRLELRDHAVAAALDRRQVTTDVHTGENLSRVRDGTRTEGFTDRNDANIFAACTVIYI
jgi:hypothetical protein